MYMYIGGLLFHFRSLFFFVPIVSMADINCNSEIIINRNIPQSRCFNTIDDEISEP